MSGADNADELVFVVSSMSKKVLEIFNMTRKNEVPEHPDILIVPSRMNMYMKKIKKSIIYIRSSS